MSIRRFLKSINGTPDPNGQLSSTVLSAAIRRMNWHQSNHNLQSEVHINGKLCVYVCWSSLFYPCHVYTISYNPCIRAEIGKYASVHGIAAASQVYSKKLDRRVGPATVQSIMQAYIKELKNKRATGVSSYPCKTWETIAAR